MSSSLWMGCLSVIGIVLREKKQQHRNLQVRSKVSPTRSGAFRGLFISIEKLKWCKVCVQLTMPQRRGSWRQRKARRVILEKKNARLPPGGWFLRRFRACSLSTVWNELGATKNVLRTVFRWPRRGGSLFEKKTCQTVGGGRGAGCGRQSLRVGTNWHHYALFGPPPPPAARLVLCARKAEEIVAIFGLVTSMIDTSTEHSLGRFCNVCTLKVGRCRQNKKMYGQLLNTCFLKADFLRANIWPYSLKFLTALTL